jgi:hypothetical protein
MADLASFRVLKKQMKKASWRLSAALRVEDTQEIRGAAIEYLDILQRQAKFMSELIEDIKKRGGTTARSGGQP